MKINQFRSHQHGIKLTIPGQCRGGKNNVIVTRSGKRFPAHSFEKWAYAAIQSVKIQFSGLQAIDKPVSVCLRYYAEDRRRRDAPAIIDGVFHVLEKAGVVSDDRWLGGEGKSLEFHFCGVDKEQARVDIEIGE